MVFERTRTFAWPFIKGHKYESQWWALGAFWGTIFYKLYSNKTYIPDFPVIQSSNSLLAKNLTIEKWEKNARKLSSNMHCLSQAMQVGIKTEGDAMGVRAGDEFAFDLFADIFNPMIRQAQDVVQFKQTHDMDASKVTGQINAAAPVHSIQISVARNLAGSPLSPIVQSAERKYTEYQLSSALAKLKDDFDGEYRKLADVKAEDKAFTFGPLDKYCKAAGMDREWPEARGVYVNAHRNFVVHVNGEDHLKMISIEKKSRCETCL